MFQFGVLKIKETYHFLLMESLAVNIITSEAEVACCLTLLDSAAVSFAGGISTLTSSCVGDSPSSVTSPGGISTLFSCVGGITSPSSVASSPAPPAAHMLHLKTWMTLKTNMYTKCKSISYISITQTDLLVQFIHLWHLLHLKTKEICAHWLATTNIVQTVD